MKLRNKKNGDTGYYLHTHRDHKTGVIKVAVLKDGEPFSEFKPHEPIYDYDNLKELNEEWEDYEEPKTFFTIYYDGTISEFKDGDDEQIRDMKTIGNYFETKEEAEKAVEKLKAWKQLKDNEISFSLEADNGVPYIKLHSKKERESAEKIMEIYNSLYLLFGGEE